VLTGVIKPWECKVFGTVERGKADGLYVNAAGVGVMERDLGVEVDLESDTAVGGLTAALLDAGWSAT
jgi:hypothetical protein